ncbi:biotin--[acetyl-CoA-carboxylase] ligase [Tessaracoccus rhinocerotis]|nr:biotin--[acetyl-CoA-carboxylase] ligase [Tessaracoccus rhinocerotis]
MLPDAAAITAALGAATSWRQVQVVPSTGSTNADLAAAARDGAAPGLVLVASEQTAGRGRRDRSWASPAGRSVAVSVLLQPRPAFPQWGWLSLLAGLAVSTALAELAPDPDRVELKWPNDVLVGGRKVCGILSEVVQRPDGACAVVGMGVNISLGEDELPVSTATSLLLEDMDTDQNRVVTTILRHFERYYARWQEAGNLRAEYEARCSSVGADLQVVVDERRNVAGRGHGVDDVGRLLVETDSGIQAFAAGDVVHARLRP